MNVELLFIGIGFLTGLVAGFCLFRFYYRRQNDLVPKSDFDHVNYEKASLSERLAALEADRSTMQIQAESSRVELLELSKCNAGLTANETNFLKREKEFLVERDRLLQEVTDSQSKIMDLSKKLVAVDSDQANLQERLSQQQQFMEEFKKTTKVEFENLANQILETKSKTFSAQTEKNLENILKPLKERITTFEKKVDDTYCNEAKERFALKAEVERLIQLNDRMTHETTSLTLALKGDSKFQGDWGELVLEKVLEASGLREDIEYSVQRQHRDDDGDKFKPDVVVNLPDSKHIVIDAKVSLKAYELYSRIEEPVERAKHLAEHIKSVLRHVDGLSEKHYPKLKGLNSPEFVFLFMPIEPAYLLVMQNDPELSGKAWRKGVAIVTATTMFTSLKTVASIWRLENQNRNALEIASEGAKLYDKFVGFLDDFEKIGKTFEVGQIQFTSAMGKLKIGPGNVFRKMEVLRELGAAPNKRIRSDLVEAADLLSAPSESASPVPDGNGQNAEVPLEHKEEPLQKKDLV